jgi:hypothetical protein
MSVRTRILIACLVVALAPLVLFALGARRAVRERLGDEFRARVSASSAVIRQDLKRQSGSLDTRLQSLVRQIDENPDIRAALLQNQRSSLLDHASTVMPTAGLDYLLLTDESGAVLSSGHFRNDYDRTITGLPTLFSATGPVLIAARKPQGNFLALARARAFQLGDRRYILIGGSTVDSTFVRGLARDADSHPPVPPHGRGRPKRQGRSDADAGRMIGHTRCRRYRGASTLHQRPAPLAHRWPAAGLFAGCHSF